MHPSDRPVLERNKHKFEPRCLPGPYMGPLCHAAVVLLFLSPGLDFRDVAHCDSKSGRDYYARQRTGECDLPEEEEHPSAHKWLTKIIGQFEIGYEEARSTVATLNISAYKSKAFSDWPLFAALPSCRAGLDWAQSVLFPQALAGKRVVVCLRSARYWGLRTGYSEGSLFCPPFSRNAMMVQSEMREPVKTAVKRAVHREGNAS